MPSGLHSVLHHDLRLAVDREHHCSPVSFSCLILRLNLVRSPVIRFCQTLEGRGNMAANPDDAQRHYYNLDEYFALEHAGDARFEYWDGDIFCMSGGTQAHGRLSGNVFYRLRLKLEGGPCLAFTADTGVKT